MFDIIEKYLAQIAQLVEQRTENPCVTGSIPVLGIIFLLLYLYSQIRIEDTDKKRWATSSGGRALDF